MVGGLAWGEVRLEEVHVGEAGADPLAVLAQPVCLVNARQVRGQRAGFRV